MSEPLIYDTHCHTPLCHHAEGQPEEYAATAARRGLAGLIITCHNPMPDDYGHSGRMDADEVEHYLELVDRARVAFADRLDVRVGMECDFFPGYESYVEQTISRLPLHHVLGSVHPQIPIWRRTYASDDARATQRKYFSMLAQSAETGLFDTLAHPDLIKNMTAEDWDFDEVRDHVARCLDRIAATGVAMELNTSGLLKVISEMNPTLPMLRLMREREIPVVANSDAHVPERVGDQFESAYDLLEEAGYTQVSFFLDRQRRDVAIAAARASLAATAAQ